VACDDREGFFAPTENEHVGEYLKINYGQFNRLNGNESDL
jgi:hypothetical protein